MGLKDRFSGTGILNSLEELDSGAFFVKKIDIDKIRPNPANDIYSLDHIDELAQNIVENGLLHNLVVKPLPDGTFRLVSGHRRRLALKKAYEITGIDDFLKPECIIRDDLSDAVDEEIALHKASIDDRQLTGPEKAARAKRLMELYKIKRNRGEPVEGKIRSLVAKDMGVSESQIQRLMNIDRLIPELKEMADSGALPVSTAEKFSGLEKDEQYKAYQKIKQKEQVGKKTTRSAAEKIKDSLKETENTDKTLRQQKQSAGKKHISTGEEENQDATKLQEKIQFLLQAAGNIMNQIEKPYESWRKSLMIEQLEKVIDSAQNIIDLLKTH